MIRFLFVIALICCADLYEYTITSDVPLDFNVEDGEEKKVVVSEKIILHESNSNKSKSNKPSKSESRKSTPSPPPRRRTPSPPRRSNVLDDSNSSAWSRVFNVFVPGSSTNKAFNEVSYDTDSFWYGDD